MRVVVVLGLLAASACTSVPPPSPDPSIAIVVSDRLPIHKHLADLIAQRLDGGARVYPLTELDKTAVATRLQSQSGAPVVAIGREAAETAARVSGRPLVYCQVHDHEARALPALARGVRATPPADKQIQAWKELDRRLTHVVLVTGPGLNALPREAKSAARRAGVRLDHLVVRSDRELLYEIKRLEPDVQGLWLAPDRRVLSSEALREAVAYSVRQGRSVLAFTPQLLDYGALLSAEGEDADIAERVIRQVRALGDSSEAGAVLPLTRVRVEVNPLVARQLGLDVPPAWAGGVRVF